MPYGKGDSLSNVKGAGQYKGKQKEAFIAAFNSCYEKGGEDSRCFAIAHSAAQRAGGGEEMDGDGMVESDDHDFE